METGSTTESGTVIGKPQDKRESQELRKLDLGEKEKGTGLSSSG